MAAPALPMGPPPGLGTPSAPPPGLHPPSGPAQANPYKRYSNRTLLLLSKSPLVQVPADMPPLSSWYGEWSGKSRNQGTHHSPMAAKEGAVGYGGYRSRDGAIAEDGAEGQNGYGQRRLREEGRLRRYDDGEPPMRMGDLGKQRFPPSGKNPFGQISASGTFRPAGKDGALLAGGGEAGLDRKYPFAGKPGRERDQPPHLAGERGARSLGERSNAMPIGGRGAGDLRGFGRRAGAGEADKNEDGEWEVMQARSPESERRLRARGEADNASDWRKGNAAARLAGSAGRLGQSAPRTDPRGATSSRTAFPAWMADESEPSWMNDDASSPSTPGGSSAPPSAKRGGFDFGSGIIKKSGEGAGGPGASAGAARGAAPRDELGSDDAPPSRSQPPPPSHGHIDSIQAFKAEMRERERLQRERNGEVADTRSGISASRPPPGLAQLAMTGEANDVDREERESSPSTAISGGGAGSAVVYDDFGGRGARPGGTQASGTSGTGGGEPPGLPGRSSRFARFFGADGKPRDPQAFALAAQQKFAQQSGAGQQPSTPLAEPSSSPAVSNAAAAAKSPDVAPSPASVAPSLSLNDLFKGLSASGGDGGAKEGASKDMGRGDSQTSATGGTSTPGGGKQPSEADMASMARLMALLGGGGGGAAGGKGSPGGAAGQSPVTQHQQQHGRSTSSADLVAQLTGGRPQTQQSQSQPQDQQGPPQWARQSPAPGSGPRQGGLVPQSGSSGGPLSPYGEPQRPGSHMRSGSQQSLNMPSPSVSQQHSASPNPQAQQAQGQPSQQGGGSGGQPQPQQQGGPGPQQQQGLPPQGPIHGLPPGLGMRPDGTFDPYLAAQQTARFGPPPPHLSRMMGPPPPGAMPGPPPNMPPQLAGLLGLARPGGPPPPGYPMGGSPFGPGLGPMSPLGPPPPPGSAGGPGQSQSPAPGQQGQSGSGGAPRSPLSPQQQQQGQSQSSQGGQSQQQQQQGGQGGPPPPPPGMPPLSSIPPHIQQQLMLIPPHLQGHYLASLATGGPGPGLGHGHGHGMGGPPGPPHPSLAQSPGGGPGSQGPPPPPPHPMGYPAPGQSHPFSQGNMMGNAAQLMAMLGGGAGAASRGGAAGGGAGGGQQ